MHISTIATCASTLTGGEKCVAVLRVRSTKHFVGKRPLLVHPARQVTTAITTCYTGCIAGAVNVSLNQRPDRTWRRPPGRPRNKWLDQLRNDSTRPIGELWRRAVYSGHGGATTPQHVESDAVI